MTPHLISRLHAAVMLALVLCIAGSAAKAQDGRPEKAEGFEAGAWVITPSLFLGYERDDNVFRREDQLAIADTVYRVTAALNSILYFRNSTFRFAYRADRLEFDSTTALQRGTNQDFDVNVDLQFSSGDTLTFANTYTRGIRDVQQIDPGGELVFSGQPFNFNLTTIEWSRLIPQRPGFLLRVQKEDSEFDNRESVAFFDTDGFSVDFEYRQPVSTYSWLTLGAGTRRLDNLDTNFDLGAEPGGPGELLERTEEGDQYLIGMRGRLGGGQNFSIQLGYEEFRLENFDDLGSVSSFSGFVGQGTLEIAEFGRSNLTLNARRGTFPSFQDTFYVATQLGLTYRLPLLRYSSLTVNGLYGENQYGDAIVWERDEGPVVRSDERILATVSLSVRWAPRAGIRLTYTNQDRNSNTRSAKFGSTVTSLGIELGW